MSAAALDPALFVSSFGASSALAILLLAIGTALTPLALRHRLGIDGMDAFMLGMVVYILAAWFAFESSVSLRVIVGAGGALSALGIFAWLVQRRLTRQRVRPRAGPILEVCGVWTLLAITSYVLLTAQLRDTDFPFTYSSNNDLFFYASSAQLMIDVGTVASDRVANFPLAENIKFNVFGDMALIGATQVFTAQSPFAFVVPSLMFAVSAIGLTIYRIVKLTLRRSTILALSCALIFVVNPLLYYIAYNYFHSQMVASIILLYLMYVTLRDTSTGFRSALWSYWLMSAVAYTLLFFTYPGIFVTFFVWQVVVTAVAEFVRALPLTNIRRFSGDVGSRVLANLASIPIVVLVLVVLFRPRAENDLLFVQSYTQKDVAGWPQPLVGATPFLGQFVLFNPVFRLDGWSVAAYALTLLALLAAIWVLLRDRTRTSERSSASALVAAGVCLCSCIGYLAVYALYGESYQQWKFAALFPLLVAFLIPCVLWAALRASRLTRVTQVPRGWAILIAAVCVVPAMLINVSAGRPFPVVGVPRAWGSLTALDAMPNLRGAFIDVDRFDETMAAAYLIRRATIVFGTPSYFPATDATDFIPSADFPLVTDKAACLVASRTNEESIGGDFYVIRGPGVPSANVRLDFKQPLCRPLVALTGFGATEGFGRWTIANRAEISLRSSPDPCCDVLITINASPFVSPGHVDQQRVLLSVNGVPVGEWALTAPQPQLLSAPVPRRALMNADSLRLTIDVPEARSPQQLGIGQDSRALGIGVESVVIEQTSS